MTMSLMSRSQPKNMVQLRSSCWQGGLRRLFKMFKNFKKCQEKNYEKKQTLNVFILYKHQAFISVLFQILNYLFFYFSLLNAFTLLIITNI